MKYRKYKNYLLGRPLELGDPDQVLALELAKHPEEIEFEDAFWRCVRCTHLNIARQCIYSYPVLSNRLPIMTPRISQCRKCAKRRLYYREDGVLYALYLGDLDKVDELKYISVYDPYMWYKYILKQKTKSS